MKEPQKVPAKGPSKFTKPGKPTTVTGKPGRYDNIAPAKPPATPDEIKKGYKVIPSK